MLCPVELRDLHGIQSILMRKNEQVLHVPSRGVDQGLAELGVLDSLLGVRVYLVEPAISRPEPDLS